MRGSRTCIGTHGGTRCSACIRRSSGSRSPNRPGKWKGPKIEQCHKLSCASLVSVEYRGNFVETILISIESVFIPPIGAWVALEGEAVSRGESGGAVGGSATLS